MKRLLFTAVSAAVVSSSLSGCQKMSEWVIDDSVGLNGGFEVTKDGLPVNWGVYTPATIPSGDYDLVIDTVEHKEGRQSLKFVVRDCASTGGWYSPGFTREYEAASGVTYHVGFWVKNERSRFRATVGGVSAFKKHEYETIVEGDDSIPEWHRYVYAYTMPAGLHRLRLEINVLSPGTFWVDDITITASGGSRPGGPVGLIETEPSLIAFQLLRGGPHPRIVNTGVSTTEGTS